MTDHVWPQASVDKYPALGNWNNSKGNSQNPQWKGGREAALLKYIKERPDFDQIRGNPPKLLQAIDDFANNEQFLINIGCDKGQHITKLLSEQRPKVIVELGGYIGYSAILFANQVREDAGTDPSGHIWSLEFEIEFADIARELVDIAGLKDMVTVVLGSADESLRKMKADGSLEHIDFLLLDHVEDLYVQDLKVCEELGLLRKGAYVVADNVVTPGAPQYREYVSSHPKLKSWGVKGLIIPGDIPDELEISQVL